MPDEPYEFLRGVALLADVSDKDLRTIAASMRRRAFAPGERIVAEGEGGIGFFFVETGSATVSKHGEPSQSSARAPISARSRCSPAAIARRP